MVEKNAAENIEENSELRLGYIYGLSAFVIWALVPIFFKEISHVVSLDILANRMIWSFAFLTVMLFFRRSWPNLKHDVKTLLSDHKKMLALFFSAFLVSTNWLIFIWAVANNHVVETSLGYFINPLVSVLLGMVFLSEKLNGSKLVAVGLAVVGVSYMIIMGNTIPWVALSLAFSFGIYGLVRKKVVVGAVLGLWAEMLILSPLALIYLLFYSEGTLGGFGDYDINTETMLILSGIVTTVPLMFFNGAAKRLPMTSLGLLQYIAPTGSLLLAVYLWNEPFTDVRAVGFSFIWSGLLIYTFAGLYRVARKRKA